MIEKICKRKSCFISGLLEPCMKLPPECDMKRPVDEVVGFLYPDLPAGFGEIAPAGLAGGTGRSASRTDCGQFAHSSSSNSGDQPPHVNDRPPIAYINPPYVSDE
jgi:hypothetical protein